MRKKLLSLLAVVLSASCFCSYAQEAAEIADGTYWVYNVDNDAFLARNGSWGTMAVLTSYGQPVDVATVDGATTFTLYDTQQTVFRDGPADATDVRSLFCDNVTNNAWQLEKAGEYFVIKNISNSTYVKITSNESGDKWLQCDPEYTADNAAKWKVMSGAEIKAYINDKALAQLNAILAKDDVTVVDAAELESLYEAQDVTSQISGIPTSRGEVYQPAGENNGGVNNSKVYLSFTIKAPKAGLYKIEVPAMYRIANNDKVAALADKDMDYFNTVIYVQGGYETVVATTSQGMTETAVVEAGSAKINVGGQDYYVPNDQDSFQAWCEAGYYANAVYAYVENPGDNITIKIECRNGRAWIGQWLPYDPQLTKVTYYATNEETPELVNTNLDFSEGTPVSVGVCTYAKDKEANGTEFAQLVPVEGWTAVDGNADAKAGGLFAYGSGAWLGGKDYPCPEVNPDGVAEGNALGVVAVWTGSAQYTQPVSLSEGVNTIVFKIYNTTGTDNLNKNLFGFVTYGGKEYLATTKSYPVGKWTIESVTVELEDAADGYISIGYKAPNSGSSANQHLFIDNVQIHKGTDPKADKTAFIAAVEAAQAKKIGFDEGEYAPYNNIEAVEALNSVIGLVDQTIYATDQDIVDEALAALNAAVWTVNETELNAFYDGGFNNATHGQLPAGWWFNGQGPSTGALVLDEDHDQHGLLGSLVNEEGTRAALVLDWNNNSGGYLRYGTNSGYTMPLKGGVEYILSLDMAKWGNAKAVPTITSPANYKVENLQNIKNGDVVYTHVALSFTPENDGDVQFIVYMYEDDNKGVIVINDVTLVRASSIENAKETGHYAHNLVLNDEAGHTTPVDFTAAKAAYERNIDEAWNTIFLPFDVAYDVWSEKYDVMEMIDFDGEAVQLQAISTEMVANTPYLVRKKDGSEVEKLSFSLENTLVSKAQEGKAGIASAELVGVYQPTAIPAASYGLTTKNTFAHPAAEGAQLLKPFRAYLNITAASEAPARIKINVAGETEGIDAIEADAAVKDGQFYDLQGRKVNNPSTGVYIFNGTKVIVK